MKLRERLEKAESVLKEVLAKNYKYQPENIISDYFKPFEKKEAQKKEKKLKLWVKIIKRSQHGKPYIIEIKEGDRPSLDYFEYKYKFHCKNENYNIRKKYFYGFLPRVSKEGLHHRLGNLPFDYVPKKMSDTEWVSRCSWHIMGSYFDIDNPYRFAYPNTSGMWLLEELP